MTAFRPDNFMLLPTMACQAGCSYCFAQKTGQLMSRATAEKAMDLIDRLVPRDRDFHLTFHGGEPLLAGEAFYSWILPELAKRFGLRAHLSIQSNLWAMTDALAELFRQYRVSVGTSLDGPQEMCDSQRGAGYFARTSAGIDLLRRHGLDTGVICTFASANADRGGEVFRSAPHPYAIHGAVPPLGSPPDNISVRPEQLSQILADSYEAYRADPGRCRITTIDSMAKGCFSEKPCTCTFFDCLGVFAAVAPDGGIYTCQRFCGTERFCLGNVNGDPSEEALLQSPAWRRLREAQDGMRRACGDCGHFSYCSGGCLYNAIAANAEKDPYCPAYRTLFDRIRLDLAREMAAVMLGQDGDTPLLSMAGDKPHPFDRRTDRAALRQAFRKGAAGPAFPDGTAHRNPYPENSLNKCYLHITFACPLHCPHCYAEGGDRKCAVLPPERLASIAQEAADRRFRSIVITGGEPLVYQDFDRLLTLLNGMDKKGSRLILRSSFAFPIPDCRLEQICRLFDEIVVSVDGSRDTHDARRGAGRYDQTVVNLEKTAALGFSGKLGLCCTLSREENEGTPGDAVRALAMRLHIEKLRFRPVLPLGRGTGAVQEEGILCEEELEIEEHFRPRLSCGLGQNLYVEPDGTAYPCYAWCEPEQKLGDLRTESLGTLLDRGGLYDYCRHNVDTNEKCRTCEVRYLCGGMCRAWAHDKHNVDSGDFDCTGRKDYLLKLAALAATDNGTCFRFAASDG